jgi:hypothetical protein
MQMVNNHKKGSLPSQRTPGERPETDELAAEVPTYKDPLLCQFIDLGRIEELVALAEADSARVISELERKPQAQLDRTTDEMTMNPEELERNFRADEAIYVFRHGLANEVQALALQVYNARRAWFRRQRHIGAAQFKLGSIIEKLNHLEAYVNLGEKHSSLESDIEQAEAVLRRDDTPMMNTGRVIDFISKMKSNLNECSNLLNTSDKAYKTKMHMAHRGFKRASIRLSEFTYGRVNIPFS